MINKKILTSNFSIKEQNSFIEKDIKKEQFFEKKISFLNKNIKGITNNYIGLYTADSFESIKKEIPLIILSTEFLKKIFVLLQENSLNRLFIINIKDNSTLIINDLILQKTIEVKTNIYVYNKDSFVINSNIFYIFKLNQKTINNKSLLYVFEDKLIYENNKNKDSYFYTINIGDNYE